MATHSSVLAWRIPGMGEPGWLLSMGSHRVGHDWSDLACMCGDRGYMGNLCIFLSITLWSWNCSKVNKLFFKSSGNSDDGYRILWMYLKCYWIVYLKIMKMVMFCIVYILPQLKKKLKRNPIICAQKTAGNKCPQTVALFRSGIINYFYFFL